MGNCPVALGAYSANLQPKPSLPIGKSYPATAALDAVVSENSEVEFLTILNVHSVIISFRFVLTDATDASCFDLKKLGTAIADKIDITDITTASSVMCIIPASTRRKEACFRAVLRFWKRWLIGFGVGTI